MSPSLSAQNLTTLGGLLLVLAILVPFAGMLIGFVFGGGNAQRVALATLAAGLAIAIAIANALAQSGKAVVYILGGWMPPLGVALRADGLSVVMLLTVAVVICGIGVYARADFGTPSGVKEARAPLIFWLLLLAVWGSLNCCTPCSARCFICWGLCCCMERMAHWTFRCSPQGFAPSLRRGPRWH